MSSLVRTKTEEPRNKTKKMGRHNFKKLKIWEEGMNIVDDTYKVIKTFPDFERYNLISQLIRCAVSIPSNISEGTSKSTNKHFNKYIEDSLGSAFEWETQMNYLGAEPPRYQNQDRCAARAKKLDLFILTLGSWFLVLGSWFLEQIDSLNATPEAKPRGILLINSGLSSKIHFQRKISSFRK